MNFPAWCLFVSLSGCVADYGCGAGKIIPFLAQRDAVTSYIGIDSAAEMIAKASWMAAQFPQICARLVCEKIEDTTLHRVDSALSINNHYTWRDTKSILRQVYRQLRTDGVFALAAINLDIDMGRLLSEAEVEVVCRSDGLVLKSRNDLITEVQSVGFHVVEAHQKLYLGGLNFLVLRKK